MRETTRIPPACCQFFIDFIDLRLPNRNQLICQSLVRFSQKKHSHIRPFILIFDCGRCCSNASCLTSQGNHSKASSPPSTYLTSAPCECVEQLSCSSTHLFFAVKALHGSPGRARTYTNSVNSRSLCHWATGNRGRFLLCNARKNGKTCGVLQVINLALGLAHLLHLWSHQWDSNPQPTDYKSVALPIALWWQKAA